jgi:hypothetical protein
LKVAKHPPDQQTKAAKHLPEVINNQYGGGGKASTGKRGGKASTGKRGGKASASDDLRNPDEVEEIGQRQAPKQGLPATIATKITQKGVEARQ